jgi:hypothetical protein
LFYFKDLENGEKEEKTENFQGPNKCQPELVQGPNGVFSCRHQRGTEFVIIFYIFKTYTIHLDQSRVGTNTDIPTPGDSTVLTLADVYSKVRKMS